MKKLLAFLLLIACFPSAYNQVIKGTVRDKQTDSPLWFASVYFNGTFVGTTTDENGFFELDISRNPSMPITVSAIGYYSSTLTAYSPGESLIIYLLPKVYELKEVVISAKSLARERRANLRLFKNEFIGTTANAQKCKIINENDITFNYDSDWDTLRAFASRPILIDNQALGYKITCYLDAFEYYRASNTVFFKGNIIFTEDLSAEEMQRPFYEKRRNSAYRGSRMHFFRALWSDNIKSSGFKVTNWAEDRLKYEDIVIQEDNDLKFLFYTEPLFINYFEKTSFIKFLTPKVYFDKNGYFDPSGINWTGTMGRPRMADWLPYEYESSLDRQTADTLSDVADPFGEDTLKIIEKVYLHTDRDHYLAGEDLWFKAYLIDASDRSLTNHSNNLHVELVSPDLKIILSSVILCDGGLGNGDFQLPKNLSTGKYKIRAYTHYMRNFKDQLFFSKTIMVVNLSDVNQVYADAVAHIQNTIEINYFPEGGSLVDSVASIVAFKATDDMGTGVDVTGELYASTGALVTSFTSAHLGMGKFSFEPVPGLSYYTVIKNKHGDMLKKEMPKSFPTGIAMSVSTNRDNGILVNFNTNAETLSNILGRELSITISARDRVLITYSFNMRSLNSYFILPTYDLPDGVTKLTLSGPDNLPLCERLVYIHNSESGRIAIETHKRIYYPRDSVILKLSLPDTAGWKQEAFLSLSAVESIFATPSSQFPATISSWFLLESDVRGPVEAPSYYFDPSNQNRIEDLDLLLCTQGWRDFKWKYDSTEYSPEKGFTVSGRVRKRLTDVPMERARINIGIFSDRPVFADVQADSSGKFKLEGINVQGSAKLIASLLRKKEQGWLILDSLGYLPAAFQDSSLLTKALNYNNPPEKGQLYEIVREAEHSDSITKVYELSNGTTPDDGSTIANASDDIQTAHVKSSRAAYSRPDLEIIVTPQMQSYSNPLQLVWGNVPNARGFENPVYMLDGNIVPVEIARGLSVLTLDRIDVLRSAQTLGGIEPRGIEKQVSENRFTAGTREAPVTGRQTSQAKPADVVFNFITRTDNLFNPKFNAAYVDFSGYYEPRIYYSPKHGTSLESDKQPDLRTTLYWEPNILLESNGSVLLKFHNSDHASTIRVMVEGITSSGIPVTSTLQYQVR